MTSLSLMTSLKALFPLTVTVDVRASTYVFWWGGNMLQSVPSIDLSTPVGSLQFLRQIMIMLSPTTHP